MGWKWAILKRRRVKFKAQLYGKAQQGSKPNTLAQYIYIYIYGTSIQFQVIIFLSLKPLNVLVSHLTLTSERVLHLGLVVIGLKQLGLVIWPVQNNIKCWVLLFPPWCLLTRPAKIAKIPLVRILFSEPVC